jgi:hypothetical protein
MISQKEKDDLVLLSYVKGCSLDDKPAKVVGRLNRFPIVAQIDGPLEAEFSWGAVKRTLDKDGKFSS